MKRRTFLNAGGALAVLANLPARAAGEAPTTLQVFKFAGCNCCGKWASHLRSAGFAVQLSEVPDTGAVRKSVGMPDRFASCHTGIVDGYAIEGHVPAAEIRRLLALRPRAIGLAVPGMPPSSPGMDVRGRRDPYQVLLIHPSGGSSVFADYPK